MSIKQAAFAAMSEARRGTIIRLILETGNFGLSCSSLQDALTSLGRPAALDVIKSDVDWLEDLGLVTTEREGRLVVATLTSRGEDVAKGRAHVSGIQRLER